MDVQELEKIKRLAIVALVSDDNLMDQLVLKGGNALDLIHGIAARASMDLDFSIENEFDRSALEQIKSRLEMLLRDMFSDAGYEVFDVTFQERPKRTKVIVRQFWGGYRLEFKLMDKSKFARLAPDLPALRRNALTVTTDQQRKFRVEISKFEYCRPKRPHELDGYTVYVYTPVMIVIEKLRAICQQMPDYETIIGTRTRRARARDFFDIYTVHDHYSINLADESNLQMIRDMFAIKKVPLHWIGQIGQYRDFHWPDFASVKDTVKPEIDLKDFDFYFDYVVDICRSLESLWVV